MIDDDSVDDVFLLQLNSKNLSTVVNLSLQQSWPLEHLQETLLPAESGGELIVICYVKSVKIAETTALLG